MKASKIVSKPLEVHSDTRIIHTGDSAKHILSDFYELQIDIFRVLEDKLLSSSVPFLLLLNSILYSLSPWLIRGSICGGQVYNSKRTSSADVDVKIFLKKESQSGEYPSIDTVKSIVDAAIMSDLPGVPVYKNNGTLLVERNVIWGIIISLPYMDLMFIYEDIQRLSGIPISVGLIDSQTYTFQSVNTEDTGQYGYNQVVHEAGQGTFFEIELSRKLHEYIIPDPRSTKWALYFILRKLGDGYRFSTQPFLLSTLLYLQASDPLQPFKLAGRLSEVTSHKPIYQEQDPAEQYEHAKMQLSFLLHYQELISKSPFLSLKEKEGLLAVIDLPVFTLFSFIYLEKLSKKNRSDFESRDMFVSWLKVGKPTISRDVRWAACQTVWKAKKPSYEFVRLMIRELKELPNDKSLDPLQKLDIVQADDSEIISAFRCVVAKGLPGIFQDTTSFPYYEIGLSQTIINFWGKFHTMIKSGLRLPEHASTLISCWQSFCQYLEFTHLNGLQAVQTIGSGSESAHESVRDSVRDSVCESAHEAAKRVLERKEALPQDTRGLILNCIERTIQFCVGAGRFQNTGLIGQRLMSEQDVIKVFSKVNICISELFGKNEQSEIDAFLIDQLETVVQSRAYDSAKTMFQNVVVNRLISAVQPEPPVIIIVRTFNKGCPVENAKTQAQARESARAEKLMMLMNRLFDTLSGSTLNSIFSDQRFRKWVIETVIPILKKGPGIIKNQSQPAFFRVLEGLDVYVNHELAPVWASMEAGLGEMSDNLAMQASQSIFRSESRRYCLRFSKDRIGTDANSVKSESVKAGPDAKEAMSAIREYKRLELRAQTLNLDDLGSGKETSSLTEAWHTLCLCLNVRPNKAEPIEMAVMLTLSAFLRNHLENRDQLKHTQQLTDMAISNIWMDIMNFFEEDQNEGKGKRKTEFQSETELSILVRACLNLIPGLLLRIKNAQAKSQLLDKAGEVFDQLLKRVSASEFSKIAAGVKNTQLSLVLLGRMEAYLIKNKDDESLAVYIQAGFQSAQSTLVRSRRDVSVQKEEQTQMVYSLGRMAGLNTRKKDLKALKIQKQIVSMIWAWCSYSADGLAEHMASDEKFRAWILKTFVPLSMTILTSNRKQFFPSRTDIQHLVGIIEVLDDGSTRIFQALRDCIETNWSGLCGDHEFKCLSMIKFSQKQHVIQSNLLPEQGSYAFIRKYTLDAQMKTILYEFFHYKEYHERLKIAHPGLDLSEAHPKILYDTISIYVHENDERRTSAFQEFCRNTSYSVSDFLGFFPCCLSEKAQFFKQLSLCYHSVSEKDSGVQCFTENLLNTLFAAVNQDVAEQASASQDAVEQVAVPPRSPSVPGKPYMKELILYFWTSSNAAKHGFLILKTCLNCQLMDPNCYSELISVILNTVQKQPPASPEARDAVRLLVSPLRLEEKENMQHEFIKENLSYPAGNLILEEMQNGCEKNDDKLRFWPLRKQVMTKLLSGLDAPVNVSDLGFPNTTAFFRVVYTEFSLLCQHLETNPGSIATSGLDVYPGSIAASDLEAHPGSIPKQDLEVIHAGFEKFTAVLLSDARTGIESDEVKRLMLMWEMHVLPLKSDLYLEAADRVVFVPENEDSSRFYQLLLTHVTTIFNRLLELFFSSLDDCEKEGRFLRTENQKSIMEKSVRAWRIVHQFEERNSFIMKKRSSRKLKNNTSKSEEPELLDSKSQKLAQLFSKAFLLEPFRDAVVQICCEHASSDLMLIAMNDSTDVAVDLRAEVLGQFLIQSKSTKRNNILEKITCDLALKISLFNYLLTTKTNLINEMQFLAEEILRAGAYSCSLRVWEYLANLEVTSQREFNLSKKPSFASTRSRLFSLIYSLSSMKREPSEQQTSDEDSKKRLLLSSQVRKALKHPKKSGRKNSQTSVPFPALLLLIEKNNKYIKCVNDCELNASLAVNQHELVLGLLAQLKNSSRILLDAKTINIILSYCMICFARAWASDNLLFKNTVDFKQACGRLSELFCVIKERPVDIKTFSTRIISVTNLLITLLRGESIALFCDFIDSFECMMDDDCKLLLAHNIRNYLDHMVQGHQDVDCQRLLRIHNKWLLSDLDCGTEVELDIPENNWGKSGQMSSTDLEFLSRYGVCRAYDYDRERYYYASPDSETAGALLNRFGFLQNREQFSSFVTYCLSDFQYFVHAADAFHCFHAGREEETKSLVDALTPDQYVTSFHNTISIIYGRIQDYFFMRDTLIRLFKFIAACPEIEIKGMNLKSRFRVEVSCLCSNLIEIHGTGVINIDPEIVRIIADVGYRVFMQGEDLLQQKNVEGLETAVRGIARSLMYCRILFQENTAFVSQTSPESVPIQPVASGTNSEHLIPTNLTIDNQQYTDLMQELIHHLITKTRRQYARNFYIGITQGITAFRLMDPHMLCTLTEELNEGSSMKFIDAEDTERLYLTMFNRIVSMLDYEGRVKFFNGDELGKDSQAQTLLHYMSQIEKVEARESVQEMALYCVMLILINAPNSVTINFKDPFLGKLVSIYHREKAISVLSETAADDKPTDFNWSIFEFSRNLFELLFRTDRSKINSAFVQSLYPIPLPDRIKIRLIVNACAWLDALISYYQKHNSSENEWVTKQLTQTFNQCLDELLKCLKRNFKCENQIDIELVNRVSLWLTNHKTLNPYLAQGIHATVLEHSELFASAGGSRRLSEEISHRMLDLAAVFSDISAKGVEEGYPKVSSPKEYCSQSRAVSHEIV
ncbi:hypothetical protein ACFL96_04015 [Thermoproteota archaeon]